MKVDLKTDDLKQIKRTLESNKVHQWLEHKANIKFEIGDILVKYLEKWDGTKAYLEVENINSGNKMPQRYCKCIRRS